MNFLLSALGPLLQAGYPVPPEWASYEMKMIIGGLGFCLLMYITFYECFHGDGEDEEDED